MAIARVQLPDGRVARLEVPDGTTPSQVESFVLNGIAGKSGDFTNPEPPTALERVGRGFADITQGVTQDAGLIRDASEQNPGVSSVLRKLPVTGGIMSLADLMAPKDTGAYTKEKTDELALYDKGRGPNAGMDWQRLAGNVAATLPVSAIGGGVTLPARIATGMGQGAIAGGSFFTPEGQSKVEQVALSTLFGGAVPLAVEGLRRAAEPVVNRVSDLMRQVPPNLKGELAIKLQQQGIDFNALTKEARDSLLSDAQKAIQTGGTLDDSMLRNKALIESVGAKGTKASITRAPRDWQTEKNLRGIQGVGEGIVERERFNAKAMTDYLQKLRAGTGGKSATALEAGESAVNAIKAGDAEKEKVVKGLYNAFRETGAADSAVPDVKIADALGRVSDEIGTENIPAAVLNRLKEFGFAGGTRTKLLTVNEADKLNRLINNNNPGHGPASLALGRLKQSLNESLMDVPGNGAEALKTARAAAAQRFAEGEASKGIASAIDDVAPDRFVQKFIVGADNRELRSTLKELSKTQAGQQAIKDIKGTILDDLLVKATNSSSVDDVAFKAGNNGLAFSGTVFGKKLDSIPTEKLMQIFSPDELKALRTLQQASKLLTQEVPFSDVNYSKTSAALANLMLKIGNTPLLGKIASPIIGTAKMGMEWVKNANDRKAVADALVASAVRAGAKPALPVSRVEKFLPGAAAAIAATPRAAE